MLGALVRLICRLLKPADSSAPGGESKFSRRTRDAAQKQPEGYGGYTPPGKPTEPPPDGQEKK